MLGFQKRKGTANPSSIFNISQAGCKPEPQSSELRSGGFRELGAAILGRG